MPIRFDYNAYLWYYARDRFLTKAPGVIQRLIVEVRTQRIANRVLRGKLSAAYEAARKDKEEYRFESENFVREANDKIACLTRMLDAERQIAYSKFQEEEKRNAI